MDNSLPLVGILPVSYSSAKVSELPASPTRPGTLSGLRWPPPVTTGVDSPCVAGTCGYVPEAQSKALGLEFHPFQVRAIKACARVSPCVSSL
jgi:hypothetical protein